MKLVKSYIIWAALQAVPLASAQHLSNNLEWTRIHSLADQGSNPAAATSLRLRSFRNSVYPGLPVSFGGDTKSRRSFLYVSGVYARGSKRSHQSALEMCNLSWTPPILERDNSKNNHVYNTQV